VCVCVCVYVHIYIYTIEPLQLLDLLEEKLRPGPVLWYSGDSSIFWSYLALYIYIV